MTTDSRQFQTGHEYTTFPPLEIEHMDGSSTSKMMELKEEVRRILGSLNDPFECMNMIDTLQRLGIDYHFEEQIDSLLISQNSGHISDGDDLYNASLRFRLLRQHGYYVSSDLFNKFKNRDGRFKQELRGDIKGIMSLYEASHLRVEGEAILDEAYEFANEHLEASLAYAKPSLVRQIEHTLKHPLHKSLQRFEARHNIETSHESHETIKVLIELSILDFNFLQSMHQRELEDVSRWWKDLGLEKELEFARIQPLKWFMWPLVVIPELQFSNIRLEITKIIAMIYVIDDIYDVYGSLEELVLFTEAVERWELEGIKGLPRYMEKCLLALYDITNDIGNLIMKKNGWNPIDNLKRSWEILCKAFLIEAKWFRSISMPKANEYLSNGITSTGVHTVLVHMFILIGEGMTKETIDKINANMGLIYFPAMILRLWDDFGTSMDEKHGGYDGSYIECYMKEHHESSIEIARTHLMNLITDAWKKLNEECLQPNHFPSSFRKAALNSARMAQVMYQFDDNRRLSNLLDHIKLLLIERISI